MPAKHLVVVLGPTAIGKTAISLSLAEQFSTEIISADSRQFYRGMPVGTAQPSPAELARVPHHFIGSRSLTEPYNVGLYEQEAIELLRKLFIKKDLVIMAGGSGLYIDAVCRGFDQLPEADPVIRRELGLVLDKNGVDALAGMLRELDPVHYRKADLRNPHRLIRAIEVCRITGKPYSELRKGKTAERDFAVIKVGLNTDRAKLYERINDRVDIMIRQGLVDEVRSLIPYKHLNALQTVGYQELFEHFEGKLSLEEAVELIKQNTRRFAKRQLTWFRKDPEITWFEPHELKRIIDHIRKKC